MNGLIVTKCLVKAEEKDLPVYNSRTIVLFLSIIIILCRFYELAKKAWRSDVSIIIINIHIPIRSK
jgi:hypothetical protein